MDEREFVLQYQADLIVKEFLEYKSREGRQAFFFIPRIQYGDYDSDGRTIIHKDIISNHIANCPSKPAIPSWCNYEIWDYHYREIISQHLNMGGIDSGYHQKHITYVRDEDQEMLCDLIYQKLYENYITGVKVYFERATETKFIFKKDLGYSYLCISYLG